MCYIDIKANSDATTSEKCALESPQGDSTDT